MLGKYCAPGGTDQLAEFTCRKLEMNDVGQRMCACGGPFCAIFFGIGLLIAGFVPPPSPALTAEAIAAVYRSHTNGIRAGMILGLFGMVGYISLVVVISVQLRRIPNVGRLASYLQLGAGSIGVLTVMFPIMIFATTAFRPERDPRLTQLLNDLGWLIIIPAFPTFIAQFTAIALGIFQDKSSRPVFPRWAAYFNLWVALLFVPGALAYFFLTGPFAWNGLFSFWLAASAFFFWLLAMTWLTLKALDGAAPPAEGS
jgi:hypothetical protein